VKIQIKYFILILLFSSCVYSKNSDPDMTTLQNAVNGDVKSEIEIGLEYIRNGEDVKKQAEGVEWIRKAAEKNSPDAQFYLGVIYENGIGVSVDKNAAEEWYVKAAQQDYIDAQYNLGVLYESSNNPAEVKKAQVWYQKAADKGDVSAMLNLGSLYNNGKGVEQDYSKAFYWYNEAAKAGDPKALYNLGQLYHLGHGVKQSDTEAYAWVSCAAERGVSQAIAYKEVIASKMLPDEMSSAKKRADEIRKITPSVN